MRPAARYAATIPTMGTIASLHVYDAPDTVSAGVIDAAFNDLAASLGADEAMFSTFRDDSSISRINSGQLDIATAPREVAEVLDACTWLEHRSGGAFTARNPANPSYIDPAGFVKGWAAQRAAQHLLVHGLEHWVLNVGGDLIAHGSPDRDASPWSIAIVDPRDDRVVRATVPIADGAVATSGTAQRGAHIWHEPQASQELASFTVIGPDLTWADAFATAGFAMGFAGLEWVNQFDDYDAIAIGVDNDIRLSRNFDRA